MGYDKDYVSSVLKNLGPSNRYSFGVSKFDEKTPGGDWNDPPVRVLIDFASDITNEDKQEQIARYSVFNRKVDFFLSKAVKQEDGVIVYSDPIEIGSIPFNSTNFSWDSYDIIKQHPIALKDLIETTVAYHLKNLFPPQN